MKLRVARKVVYEWFDDIWNSRPPRHRNGTVDRAYRRVGASIGARLRLNSRPKTKLTRRDPYGLANIEAR